MIRDTDDISNFDANGANDIEYDSDYDEYVDDVAVVDDTVLIHPFQRYKVYKGIDVLIWFTKIYLFHNDTAIRCSGMGL